MYCFYTGSLLKSTYFVGIVVIKADIIPLSDVLQLHKWIKKEQKICT